MYIIDDNTVGVTVRYIEPVVDANGNPLSDLDHTNVFYQFGSAAPNEQPNIAATGATGGGTITTVINVPIARGQAQTVSWWAVATDINNLISISSNLQVVFIDRRFFPTPVSMPHLGYRPGYVR